MDGYKNVKVVRSARRKKTVSATVDKGVLIVRIPARMSKAEEAYWIQRMGEKLSAEAYFPRPELTRVLACPCKLTAALPVCACR